MSAADIDRIFDTYDEDGGGYMDEDEAKAMIRGLQKNANEAEHQRVSKEREARRARAVAIKKATSAMAPPSNAGGNGQADSTAVSKVAATIEPLAGGTERPPRSKINANGASLANGMLRAPRLKSSPLLEGLKEKVVTALSSSTRRNREAQSSERRIALKCKQVLQRLSQQAVSQAWNQWAAYTSETKRIHNMLARVVASLANPMLQIALRTWVDWYEQRTWSIALLRRATTTMLAAQTTKSFQAWAGATRRSHLGQRRGQSSSGVERLQGDAQRQQQLHLRCAAVADWLRCHTWIGSWCVP